MKPKGWKKALEATIDGKPVYIQGEVAPPTTVFQYYGPPPGSSKAIKDYGIANKQGVTEITETANKFSIDFSITKFTSMFKCMTWKEAAGWPTDKPTHDCCSDCHAQAHSKAKIRVVGLNEYKVCCGTANLCLKDLKKKWWCSTCVKDATPVNYEDEVICFACSEPVSPYTSVDINPLTEWCPSCNVKGNVIVDKGKPGYKEVVYCAKCKWPIKIQKEPLGGPKQPSIFGTGILTGAYKKYIEEHMNTLVPNGEGIDLSNSSKHQKKLVEDYNKKMKLYNKKMKLKELYGGNAKNL